MDRILIQGRWQTQKSARLYINEGLAMLASMRLPAHDPKIKPFLSVFQSCSHSKLPFSTLEPPSKVDGSSGGRGKRGRKQSKSQKKRQKTRFRIVQFSYQFFCYPVLGGVAQLTGRESDLGPLTWGVARYLD